MQLDNATVVILTIIFSIVILELVALCVVGLDGVALSGSVAALTSIALKRQDIYYKLRNVKTWKSLYEI